eukprot:11487118-Alexandrium_andersonii.AAC.1
MSMLPCSFHGSVLPSSSAGLPLRGRGAPDLGEKWRGANAPYPEHRAKVHSQSVLHMLWGCASRLSLLPFGALSFIGVVASRGHDSQS